MDTPSTILNARGHTETPLSSSKGSNQRAQLFKSAPPTPKEAQLNVGSTKDNEKESTMKSNQLLKSAPPTPKEAQLNVGSIKDNETESTMSSNNCLEDSVFVGSNSTLAHQDPNTIQFNIGTSSSIPKKGHSQRMRGRRIRRSRRNRRGRRHSVRRHETSS
ncbi:MAG: hypothetical protein SGBAC_013233 [Bacillariaceae sp.]